MRTPSTLALAVLLTTSASARAEFVMLGPEGQPQTAETTPPAQQQTAHEAPPQQATSELAKPVAHKKQRTGAIALGFGRSVPLSFAVRQIVPASIKVRYEKPEDADALVDWQGGREWRVVLQDAVRDLGLRLIVRGSTALISK